jgi:hypothetical protein
MSDLNMTPHTETKDTTHIGEIAAQQPLSGVVMVMPERINGVSNNRFYYAKTERKSA